MTSPRVHPGASVDPSAVIGDSVEVGPLAVIEAGVEVGEGSLILPGAVLLSGTVLGRGCVVHPTAVLGGAPQDLGYKGEPTRLVVGDQTVFREGVTANRATGPGCETRIGSRCLFMATAHVGHNSVVGDDVILANAAALGGHVHVGDRAFLSSQTFVHQFCHVGRLAMMSGGAGISLDLPPFLIATGMRPNELAGVNVVGLRRAGVSREGRIAMKKAFRILCRSGEPLERVLRALEDFESPEVQELARFVRGSKRGVVRLYGTPRGPKARREEDLEEASSPE